MNPFTPPTARIDPGELPTKPTIRLTIFCTSAVGYVLAFADGLNLKSIDGWQGVDAQVDAICYFLGPICMIAFVLSWLSLARYFGYLNLFVPIVAVVIHFSVIRFTMFIREHYTSPW